MAAQSEQGRKADTMSRTIRPSSALLSLHPTNGSQPGDNPPATGLGTPHLKERPVSLSRIRRIADPVARATAAADYLRAREAKAAEEIAEIRAVRDDAVRQMLATIGPTGKRYRQADAARAIGVTRSAVALRFSPHSKAS